MADDYRLAAILSAGVERFDAIEARGEKTALRVLELVAGLLESRALELGGTLRSSSGPTFIAEFPSALMAVRCALEVSGALAWESVPQVRLRLGVHLGDIWFLGSEALGDGVEIARRLQALAAPGAIALSDDVSREVEGRIGGTLRSLGYVEVRSLGRTIEAYELSPARAAGEAAGEAAAGTTGGAAGEAARDAARPAGQVARAAEDPAAEGGRILDRLLAAGRMTSLAGVLPAAVERLFSSPARPHPDEVSAQDQTLESGIEAEREAARAGVLRTHLWAFAIGSGVLLAIWLVATPFRHPWFLYPIGAWAIGLAHQLVARALRKAQRREVGAHLSAELRRTLRRLHRAESRFAHHLTAFASVSGYLFMVNMVATPGLPWFLFPTAGWSVGLISHNRFYRVQRKALEERLRRLGVARGELSRLQTGSANGGRFGLLVDEAGSIRDSLVRQIRSSEPLRTRLGAELVPLLERYVGQISGLNERSRELEMLLSTVSEASIDAEITNLRAGRTAARSASVQAEYDRAITEHTRQKESLEELRGQQEILDLRIKGSVLALKRIEMDVARMKGLDTADVLGSLQKKSDELSRYLEDLKAGYSELE